MTTQTNAPIISALRTFVLGACLVLAVPASGQFYKAGDIVQDFTLTDRETGQPVQLSDFEGKIVFLEWFAWWCPFCQAAAAQTGPDIHQYYESRGGNAHGVPVAYVAVNLQAGQESQTQSFINAYGLGTVLNDFSRAVANRFQGGGQPIFAIINGVADSPSHDQWELVYSHLGYGDLDAPTAEFRAAIESVRAPEPAPAGPPVISAQPVSRTVPPGEAAVFAVEATGDGALTYQWSRDGVAISGATSATLEFEAVVPADAGDYTVTVTNAGGSTTSRFARLVVAAPVDGQLINLSVRGVSGTAGAPLIVGFVVEGGLKDLLVRGIGPALLSYGVAGALTDPALTIYSGGASVTENDDWATGGVLALQDAFGAVGAFPLAQDSHDAAVRADLGGPHTAHVSGKLGQAGVTLVEVYDANTSQGSRLVNLSARNHVGSGDEVLVAGFIMSGNKPRRLLIRGVGPGLGQFGVTGFLADPVMEVHTVIHDVDTIVATNDDWGDEPDAAGSTSVVPGAFALPEGSKDAVLLLTLPASSYTVVVRGQAGGTGEALIEVYEAP